MSKTPWVPGGKLEWDVQRRVHRSSRWLPWLGAYVTLTRWETKNSGHTVAWRACLDSSRAINRAAKQIQMEARRHGWLEGEVGEVPSLPCDTPEQEVAQPTG